jgi:outer membrane biosynthesis protein TonB
MPIATVQPQDAVSDCAMITAEIEANNIKFKELADEQGLKTGQNIAAGVAGIVIWPLWFAMDFKGAASKDVVALQSRQQYLTSLATQRCHQTPPPPVAAAPPPRRTAAVKPKPQAQPQPPQAPTPSPQAQPTPPPSQN